MRNVALAFMAHPDDAEILCGGKTPSLRRGRRLDSVGFGTADNLKQKAYRLARELAELNEPWGDGVCLASAELGTGGTFYTEQEAMCAGATSSCGPPSWWRSWQGDW